MKKAILDKLHALECDNDIEILYACESGSRAWGFSNDKSDYDVRFIYRKAKVKDYLTLRKDSDVIENSDGLFDLVGWDIKKALKLHFNDNPNLREWLITDRVYLDRGIESIFDGLGDFDRGILMNHYLAISKKHYRKYCKSQFNPKKYLYVIRSILSAMVLVKLPRLVEAVDF